MQIKVDLDDGFLPRIYTSNANVKHSGQPILSFPIEIKSIPAITTAFAISLIDYDAVPRTGFTFIHSIFLSWQKSQPISVVILRAPKVKTHGCHAFIS